MKFDDILAVNQQIKTTNIKGKEYAQVNERIKAFRMIEPNGCIDTELISFENGMCIVKATIIDSNGIKLATGMAYERESSSIINKTSCLENCETSAVGRALGMIGFGIETSVASYEEVKRAIEIQEDMEQRERMDSKERVICFLNERSGEDRLNLLGYITKKYNHGIDEMSVKECNDFISEMKRKGKVI